MVFFFKFFFQSPAFPKETPESIKSYIEETYLSPRLDSELFSPEKGRQWDFDWFDKANVPLEPSIPRSVIIPKWELPFRRRKKGPEQGKWEPRSVQVLSISLNCLSSSKQRDSLAYCEIIFEVVINHSLSLNRAQNSVIILGRCIRNNSRSSRIWFITTCEWSHKGFHKRKH